MSTKRGHVPTPMKKSYRTHKKSQVNFFTAYKSFPMDCHEAKVLFAQVRFFWAATVLQKTMKFGQTVLWPGHVLKRSRLAHRSTLRRYHELLEEGFGLLLKPAAGTSCCQDICFRFLEISAARRTRYLWFRFGTFSVPSETDFLWLGCSKPS